MQHVQIFGNLALSNILVEKRRKSNYQKVWQGVLVSYSLNTKKDFRIWAPQTKQIVIASELYIDKTEKGARVLAKWLLDVTQIKKKHQ